MRWTSSEGTLFNQDPAAYLPHRPPFLLLDRLVEVVTGDRATAVVSVTIGTICFPEVLFIEAMAQLGGIVAGHEEGEGGFLAAIDHAEIHGSASAGDMLLVSVRVLKSFGRLHLLEGEVREVERLLASATLTIGMGRV